MKRCPECANKFPYRNHAALTSTRKFEKLGGRKKGTRNKVTESIKALLNTLLPEDELAELWKKKPYHKDPQIAMKALELAYHYLFGKPGRTVVGEELAPSIKIDISAIPKHRERVKRWPIEIRLERTSLSDIKAA